MALDPAAMAANPWGSWGAPNPNLYAEQAESRAIGHPSDQLLQGSTLNGQGIYRTGSADSFYGLTPSYSEEAGYNIPWGEFVARSGYDPNSMDTLGTYGVPALMAAMVGGANLWGAGMGNPTLLDVMSGGFGTGGGAIPSFAAPGGAAVGPSGLPEWSTLWQGLQPGEWDWMRRGRDLLGGKTSGLFNIGSGLYGLYQSGQTRRTAERAAQMQDPFGPERAGYAAQLRNLMANPGSITSLPGYQAGIDAVTRKMAGQGYLGSGNMMAALQKYGGDAFNQEAARLANLAGAQFGPSGGNALLSGTNSANDLLSRSLASLGYGLRGFEDIFGRS